MPEWSRLNRDQLTAGTEFVPVPTETTFKTTQGRPLAEIMTTLSGKLELRTKARIDRQRGGLLGIGHSVARNTKLAFGNVQAIREDAEHGFDKSVDSLIEDVANGAMPTVGFLRKLVQIDRAGAKLEATDAAHATGVPASDNPVKRFGENLLLGLLAVRRHDPAKGRMVLIKLGLLSDALQLRIERLDAALTMAQARDAAATNRQLHTARTKLDSLKAYVAQLNTIRDALVIEEFGLPEVPDVQVDSVESDNADGPEVLEEADNNTDAVNDAEAEIDAEADEPADAAPERRGTIYEEHFEVGGIANDVDRTDALKKAIGQERARREEALQSSLPEHVRAFNHGLVEHKEKVEKATKSVIVGMADAARRDQRAYARAAANVRPTDPVSHASDPIYPELDRRLTRRLREFQTDIKRDKIDPQKALQLYKDLYAAGDHWDDVKKAADDRLFLECLAIAETEADLWNSRLPPENRITDAKGLQAKAQRYMNVVLRNGACAEELEKIQHYQGLTDHDLNVVLHEGSDTQQLAVMQYLTGATIDRRFGPQYDKMIAKQAGNLTKLQDVMLDMHKGIEGAAQFKRLVAAYERERAR